MYIIYLFKNDFKIINYKGANKENGPTHEENSFQISSIYNRSMLVEKYKL